MLVFDFLTYTFSRVLRDSTPRFVRLLVCPSVGLSVRQSVTLLLFWPQSSCPNNQVTSNMALAHPHATGVAVYPALFQPQFKSFLLTPFPVNDGILLSQPFVSL